LFLVHQVRKIAELIVELDQDIPYALLAFHPAFEMMDLPTTSRREAVECLEAANKIGYPVALKIVSPDILHKVDVGGVKINIKDEKQLLTGY